MALAPPLVSLLVLVRDGAATLPRALETLKSQTYENLEIILSDNDSSDATPEIMKAFAATEPRSRYVRQRRMPFAEHFATLARTAKGKYLVFCAADDERNAAFVESLVESLERDPAAVLAFGRVITSDPDGRRQREVPFRFESGTRRRRLQRAAWLNCYHIYGMWRTSVLQAIRVRECTYCPDRQIMMSATCRGTFIRNDGAVLTSYEIPKTDAERAEYQSYRPLPFFYKTSMISTAAIAIIEAGAGLDAALWGASMLAVRETFLTLKPRHHLRRASTALKSLVSGLEPDEHQ